MSQSKIFTQNRALGYVSNHIPAVTRYIERRKENLIVTCVGKAFHTYGCTHFTLLSVSGKHPSDITCLSADKYHVYTASGTEILAWRRGNELKHTYKSHKHPVHLLLPFGAHLVSVDENSTVKTWNIKTEEELLQLDFSNDTFKITTIIHPNTYMNKILLGSEQGQLQLWNLKKCKMIYLFNGWGVSITALEQAPALDVVAIGLVSGKIILHNIKFDETVFELFQDWGPVTNITFRSDGQPIMATGSLKGHITMWNLEKRKVESQIMAAHCGSVTGLKCLPNEPLMISSSPDNSLKLWIFDLADGAGRLLRIREGHAEPPTYVRFYGTDGSNILSAGGDSSLRIFSTITETFNKSLGRASFDRKASKKKGLRAEDPLIMPAITEIVAEKTREKEWDNVAARHSGLGVVTTWSYNKLKMGEHKLLPERFQKNYNAVATSLCLTLCGNFVVVGYNTGHVDRFNIQSAIHRGTYGDEEKGAHSKAVRGIAVDPLNQVVVTASKDRFVKFWAFATGKGGGLKTKLELEEAVSWLRTHKETSLIALAIENFDIILIDIDTRKIVRRFEGHTAHLTDATFNPDSRWLVTASLDCTIRVWDIPSSKLVDIFKVPEGACTSIHFSPIGDYLVTSHVCNLGLYLWSNKTLFSHVSLKAIDANKPIPVIELSGSNVEETEVIEEDEEEEDYKSADQISKDLITMTSAASTKWQNLLDIELVKKRNKPKEAPKVMEAPFFLPTIPSLGTDVKFDLSESQNEDKSSKIITPLDFQSLSMFGKLVYRSIESGDFDEPIKMLKLLGPGSIDIEIKALDSSPSQTVEVMVQFMKMIQYMFKSKVDFELAQAYLGVFLKNHGQVIKDNEKLRNYLKSLERLQMESWHLLRKKLFYNKSVVQYLKTT